MTPLGAPVEYEVYRSEIPGGQDLGAPVAVLAGDVTSWTDTDVLWGVTYYYRLSSLEGALEGTLSAEVQAIPQGGAPSPPRSSRIQPNPVWAGKLRVLLQLYQV